MYEVDIKAFCAEAERIMNENKKMCREDLNYKFRAIESDGHIFYEFPNEDGSTVTVMDLRAIGYDKTDDDPRHYSYCYYQFKPGEVDRYSPRDLAFHALGMIAVDMQRRRDAR